MLLEKEESLGMICVVKISPPLIELVFSFKRAKIGFYE